LEPSALRLSSVALSQTPRRWLGGAISPVERIDPTVATTAAHRVLLHSRRSERARPPGLDRRSCVEADMKIKSRIKAGPTEELLGSYNFVVGTPPPVVGPR
jgi:hypothetical protein